MIKRAILCVALLALFTAARATAAERQAARTVSTAADRIFPILLEQRGNFCFSPLSIASALAMTYAGAAGETASELAGVFAMSSDIYGSFSDLMREITESPDPAVDVRVANSAWPRREFRILPRYRDLLASSFHALVQPLDYEASPDLALSRINDWVAEGTDGRIKDLLAPGSVDAETALMLVNTVFMRAPWIEEFPRSLTSDDVFHAPSGDVLVPFMSNRKSYFYAESSRFRSVKLLYRYGALSMTVIVPTGDLSDDGARAALSNGLTAVLAELDDVQRRQELVLRLPKFKTDSSLSLKTIMQQLGVRMIFSPSSADLSGINGARDLYVNEALHRAFVEVDEKGTEAAAATVVGIRATAVLQKEEPIELRVDRPFAFVIRDEPSGAMLFAGWIELPEGRDDAE